MIGTPITIKNHENGHFVTVNDHVTDEQNVIALQSFPTFQSEVRQQNLAKLGAHGEFRLPYYYGGMSIVLQGVIVGDSEASVWTLRKQFDTIMQLSRKGFPAPYIGNDEFPPMGNNTVRLSFVNPAGDSVFVDASPIQVVSYERPLKQNFLLNFQVILRANFPYLLIKEELPTQEDGLFGRIDYGFKLGTKVPFSIYNQYVQNEMTITVPTQSMAVLTMNGSDDGTIVNPTIINLTNGSYTKIRRPLSGVNSRYIINGVYKTMRDKNNFDVTPFSDGDFVYLSEGENKLVYIGDDVIFN